MIINKTKPNSFIYILVKKITIIDKTIIDILDFRNILVKIGYDFYLFKNNSKDFSYYQIEEIYNKQQIYINIKGDKVSHDFLSDYRKLKKNGNYFEIEKKNLFIESEKKILSILDQVFIGNCLDIGCGDSIYKEIFNKQGVNYLGIDIHKINNGLNIIETTFEDFKYNDKFDVLFFFRSINHFSDTSKILEKAFSFLNNKGKIFIVENEAFGEIKLKDQIFEGKNGDFEHYFNYSLVKFKKLVNNDYFNIIEEDHVSMDKANQWYILLERK